MSYYYIELANDDAAELCYLDYDAIFITTPRLLYDVGIQMVVPSFRCDTVDR